MNPSPESSRLVTLKDVAASLGLHPSTASLALREDPRIPPATRERVRRAAEALGYRPNPLVAALMQQRRGRPAGHVPATLAFIPLRRGKGRTFRDSYSESLYHEGFRARATELGFRVEVFDWKDEGMTFRRLTQILQSRGIRGLSLGVNETPRGHLPMPLEGFAVVAHGYSVLRPLLPRVTHDHSQGILLACRSLLKLGYKRIGYVAHRVIDDYVNNQWLAGFSIYGERHQRGTRIPPLLLDEHRPEPVLRWWREHRPDAIVSIADHVIGWLREAGVRVPEDCAYAQLDLEAGDRRAGIDQQSGSIGRIAAETLIGQLLRNHYGVPDIPTVTLIEGVWRDGLTAPRRQ